MEIISSIAKCPKCGENQAEFWVALIKPKIKLPVKKKKMVISAKCDCGFHIDKVSEKRIEKFLKREEIL